MRVVRAAGGVVLDDEGNVVLVHRPQYDDWTFPKGKANADETDEDCAVREIHEETGLRCRLDRELSSTEYVDTRGRDKRVRWWLATPIADDGFTPNKEVDELRRVLPATAATMLSYGRDVALLGEIA